MTSANSKKGVEYLRDSLLYPLAQNISNIMVFSGLYFHPFPNKSFNLHTSSSNIAANPFIARKFRASNPRRKYRFFLGKISLPLLSESVNSLQVKTQKSNSSVISQIYRHVPKETEFLSEERMGKQYGRSIAILRLLRFSLLKTQKM